MRKIGLMLLLTMVMIFTCMLNVSAYIHPSIQQKAQAHATANESRSAGLPESDPTIINAQKTWWQADAQFNTDRDIVATVVYNEAWGGCSTRHRELVAAVVCNRVGSNRFPNSVYSVVVQKGQYHPAYANAWGYYGQRARQNPTNWAECQRIATKALRGEVVCPANVVYQANFRQGSGVYEIHKTSYSTTYFCFI